MKNKEIMKVLGLTVALTMNGCGTVASQPQPEPVEEVAEVAEEEPTPTPTPTPEPVIEEEKEVENVSEVSENSIDKADSDVEKDVRVDKEKTEYEIEPMDDTAMWATQQSNVRNKPYIDGSEIVGSLKLGQEVIVNGRAVYNGKTWYVLKTEREDDKEFVSSSLLSKTQPSSSKSNESGSNNNTSVTQVPTPPTSDYKATDSSGYEGYSNIEDLPDLGTAWDFSDEGFCEIAAY